MKTICCALLGLVTGCGGSVVATEDAGPGDAGSRRDARRDAPSATVEAASPLDSAPAADSYVLFQEDACGEVMVEPPMLECDPLAPVSQCPAGEGCYPIPPRASGRCRPGTYATRCLAAGVGGQGDPCGGGSDCAGGFICVKSSVGDQCVRLCQTNVYGACGEGRICIEVDVTGSGLGGCQ